MCHPLTPAGAESGLRCLRPTNLVGGVFYTAFPPARSLVRLCLSVCPGRMAKSLGLFFRLGTDNDAGAGAHPRGGGGSVASRYFSLPPPPTLAIASFFFAARGFACQAAQGSEMAHSVVAGSVFIHSCTRSVGGPVGDALLLRPPTIGREQSRRGARSGRRQANAALLTCSSTAKLKALASSAPWCGSALEGTPQPRRAAFFCGPARGDGGLCARTRRPAKLPGHKNIPARCDQVVDAVEREHGGRRCHPPPRDWASCWGSTADTALQLSARRSRGETARAAR